MECSSYVPTVGFVLIVKRKKVSVTKNDCPRCKAFQAEINGLREVVRNQGEFILAIKKFIADYSGESQHWGNRH